MKNYKNKQLKELPCKCGHPITSHKLDGLGRTKCLEIIKNLKVCDCKEVRIIGC